MNCSIIICTYNGKNRLQSTLEHIARQQFSSRISVELLLIDNNSSDGTFEWAETWFQVNEFPFNWRILVERKQGLSFARKLGVEEAKYPIILFCDDDNYLNSDYIQLGAKYLELNSQVGVLGGCGFPEFESESPYWFTRYSHSYGVGTLGKKNEIQPPNSWHYGAGCFFRSIALKKLNDLGFVSLLSDRKGNSLSSGGDVELCLAVQNLGYKLAFDPELKFVHFIEKHRLSWGYYLNLKSGTASSFPLLEAYRFYEFKNGLNFRIHLVQLLWVVFKGIVKTTLFEGDIEQDMIDKVVVRTKFRAFFKNYSNTILGYKRNMLIFSR